MEEKSDVKTADIHNKTVEDDRIDCSNSQTLDDILEIVKNNFSQLADAINVSDRKSQFVNRFTEIFKNTLQENVTVGGLPWVVQREKMGSDHLEKQKEETKNELLSRLSKTLEVATNKRKHHPPSIRKFYAKTLEQQFQKLKHAKLDPSVHERLSSNEGHIPIDEAKELGKEIISLEAKLKAQMEQLKELQQDVVFSQDVVSRKRTYQEFLYDTGYESSLNSTETNQPIKRSHLG